MESKRRYDEKEMQLNTPREAPMYTEVTQNPAARRDNEMQYVK